MRTNEEILNNQKHGFNRGQFESGLDAMKEAQMEILEELERRWDEHVGEVDLWDLLHELKEELK